MGHTPLPKNCEQSPGALQLRLQVIGGRGERTLAGAFRVVLESHKKKHSTELKSYALCANALQSCSPPFARKNIVCRSMWRGFGIGLLHIPPGAMQSARFQPNPCRVNWFWPYRLHAIPYESFFWHARVSVLLLWFVLGGWFKGTATEPSDFEFVPQGNPLILCWELVSIILKEVVCMGTYF